MNQTPVKMPKVTNNTSIVFYTDTTMADSCSSLYELHNSLQPYYLLVRSDQGWQCTLVYMNKSTCATGASKQDAKQEAANEFLQSYCDFALGSYHMRT